MNCSEKSIVENVEQESVETDEISDSKSKEKTESAVESSPDSTDNEVKRVFFFFSFIRIILLCFYQSFVISEMQ